MYCMVTYLGVSCSIIILPPTRNPNLLYVVLKDYPHACRGSHILYSIANGDYCKIIVLGSGQQQSLNFAVLQFCPANFCKINT